MKDADVISLIEEEGIVSIQTQLTGFFVKALYGGKFQQADEEKKTA
jgi:hypothetical protein